MTSELGSAHREWDAWLRAIVAALGISGLLLAAILLTTTATLGPASIALATALGVLLVALRSLFGVVQVLAVPDAKIIAVDGEPLGLASSALRDEHRRVLRAINDLAFEHSMGKIGEADHRELSTAYRLRAIELMRALDRDRQISPGLVRQLQERGIRLPSNLAATQASPEGGATHSGLEGATQPEPAVATQPAEAATPSVAFPVDGEEATHA